MAQIALVSPNVSETLRRIEYEIERDPSLQSLNSRRGYMHDLRAFEKWRQRRTFTKLLVEEYAAHLLRLKRSPNSVNRALAAVRWWARRLSDLAFESEMTTAQRDDLVSQASRVASIEDVTGDRQQKGRHIGTDELQALLQACRADQSPAGVRDSAILALAWSTGLRRSEIVGLKLEDWKRHLSGQPIEVKGKGNKRRYAYLNKNAESWLRSWLRIRGASEGPLFCPIRKGGKIQPRRGISDEALAQILAKRSLQANIAQPLTWHDFRRTFAGNLLDSGVDLATVQRLLGHSSPVTTSNYDRRGEATKQRAARSINIPFWTDES